MQEQLNRLLDMLQKGLDWTAGQLPLLAQEIIEYGIAINLIYSVSCILGIILCLFGLKWAKKLLDNANDIGIPVCIFSCFGILGLSCILIWSGTDAIKARYAPRLYLIEQVSSLVKGK